MLVLQWWLLIEHGLIHRCVATTARFFKLLSWITNHLLALRITELNLFHLLDLTSGNHHFLRLLPLDLFFFIIIIESLIVFLPVLDIYLILDILNVSPEYLYTLL
jgi:hypothetical protein